MTHYYSAHAPWGDTLASEYAENVTTYTLFSLFSHPVSNTVPLCATDILTTWRYITGPAAKPAS